MKKLLVALDQSSQASVVLQAAIALAKEVDGKLVLLRAVHVPDDFAAEAYSTTAADLSRLLKAGAEDELESMMSAVPNKMREAVRVESGVAWQVICKAARVENADLVVVGTHGMGGRQRTLGSTAAKVVVNCDRPVLVHRTPPPPILDATTPAAELGYELF